MYSDDGDSLYRNLAFALAEKRAAEKTLSEATVKFNQAMIDYMKSGKDLPDWMFK